MKVLFCIRPDYKIRLGGDSVQMLTTFKYLTMRGVDVCINNDSLKNYEEFDIIHLFNLTRIAETYRYFKIAQKSGKPIVLTPIYWDLKKYYTHSKNNTNLCIWNTNAQFRREILDGCSMVYPSSLKEQLLLQQLSGNTHYTLIYNCIDVASCSSEPAVDSNKYSTIFCAARICPRKNQHILANVCKELGETLLLAGDVNNRDYLDKCLQYENVRYLGFLQNNQVLKIYKASKLHVLCSFVETPGLSSLEAGACGCNIISTREGSTEEYFGDLALYCDPYNDTDIYNSIKQGLSFNKQPLLQEHLLQHYALEKCLEPLYNSYCRILSRAL